jgi:hypothetical protein
MPTTNDQIRTILAKAETEIKSVIARELDAGNFSQVERIARIGDALSELARIGAGSTLPTASRNTGPANNTVTMPAKRNTKPSKPRRSSKKASKYPRFERDGSRLIKIGWSKKSREEYEHRATREVAQAFARALWDTTEPGKTFTMEQVLPVQDSSGDELPDYQSYLSLAWLRSEGAIEKMGRDGYVLIFQDMDTETFDTLWNQLPERP